MKLSIQAFKGVSPRTNPRHLPDGGAQVALNVEAFGQSVKPIVGPSAALLTLAKSGVIQTLYRFGQDLSNETQYWFHWLTSVDVCRSQIAGDTSEWTFYTGDGYPKATHTAIAVSGGTQAYPTVSRRLGLPAPTNILTVEAIDPQQCYIDDAVADTYTTKATCEAAGGTWVTGAYTRPAKVTIGSSRLPEITSDYGVKVSTSINSGTTWNEATATITDSSPPSVTMSVANVAAITDAFGFYVSLDNGTTKTMCPITTSGGTAPSLTIPSAATITPETTIKITVDNGANYAIFPAGTTGTTMTPALLAAQINRYVSSKVAATVSGTGVLVTALKVGKATVMILGVGATVYGPAVGTDPTVSATALVASINANAKINGTQIATATGTSTVTITAARGGADVILKVLWGLAANQSLTAAGGAASISVIATAIDQLANVTAAVVDSTVVVTSVDKGAEVRLKVQWGDGTGQTLTGAGTTLSLGTAETRVYTYTYINDEADLVMESAPWAPDNMATATVDVYAGGSVKLIGLPTAAPAGGWSATGLRIYRATAGTYLFVEELKFPISSYTDTVAAADLGEECPSVLWSAPPEDMQGLINLPNGMMAGFSGRDIYLCDPYHPFAWPDTYMQSVDFPVVGLGRLDTTLVVLTKGTPYLIQGSSPEFATVVKSDIEQACISKRSIVSQGGAVIYASPDGLVMLSTSGSQLLTVGMFTRADWQKLNPSTIHAYGHDNLYIAFHDPQTETIGGISYTYYGFIVDMTTQQFIRHNLSGVTAGYADLRNDQLYLVTSNRGVVKWGQGANLVGTWRSKVFALPQITGFSCAQVEAKLGEYAGIKAQIFRDGQKHVTDISEKNLDYVAPDTTKIPSRITGRYPFRLEPKQGREWEVELEVTQEIFNVCIAQSMSEIAGA